MQQAQQETLEDSLKSLFINALPARPYCTDSFTKDGLYRLPKHDALTKKTIQQNPAAKLEWMVFDIDVQGAAFTWEWSNIAPPNMVVINPKNGHAHVFYLLKTPICRTNAARLKPLEYAAAIEYAMKSKLLADFAYAGLVSKNPLSSEWRTIFMHQNAYDLADLAEYLPKLPNKRERKAEVTGLGRNCTLFEKGRKQAYKRLKQFKHINAYQSFKNATEADCMALNAGFNPPLPDREVKQVAASVSKWAWSKFNIADSDRRFAARQAARGKHKGTHKRDIGFHLLGNGETPQDVAESIGVSIRTVYRWCHDLGYKFSK